MHINTIRPRSGVAQSAEHSAVNRNVSGSNPFAGVKISLCICLTKITTYAIIGHTQKAQTVPYYISIG